MGDILLYAKEYNAIMLQMALTMGIKKKPYAPNKFIRIYPHKVEDYMKVRRARRAREENWVEITPGWLVRPKFDQAIPWYLQCAHRCKDGKVRAVERYGTTTKYTRCWGCNATVDEKARAYFNLRQLAK